MSRRFAGLTGIKGLSDIFLDTRLFRMRNGGEGGILAEVISRWRALLGVDPLPQVLEIQAFIREAFPGRSGLGDFEARFRGYFANVVATAANGSTQNPFKNRPFSRVPASCLQAA